MAVNKVEYISDSLTANFADAGDEITIKKSNAQTIQNDVENNVTEELTDGQQKYLEKTLETQDSGTEYNEGDGSEEVPEDESQQLEDMKSEFGTGSGTAESVATSLAFGAMTLTAMTTMAATAIPVGVSLSTGPAFLAAGTASIISAGVFDSDYSSRLNEASNAENYIASMQEYITAMNEDLQGVQATDGNAETSEEVSEKIETISAVANDMITEYSTVSEFLQQGTELGVIGALNSVQLIASAALGGIAVAKVFALEATAAWNPFLFAALKGIDLPGKIMVAAGAVMMGVAAGIMVAKSANETKAGVQGAMLATQLAEFAPVVSQYNQLAETAAPEEGEGEGDTPPTTDSSTTEPPTTEPSPTPSTDTATE